MKKNHFVINESEIYALIMKIMFVVSCSKKSFFLKCLQYFFQVDMEPFIEKNIGIRSQRVGMNCGREKNNSKMDDNRRSF